MVWLIGVLCWWVLDAFLLPGWIRGFQANYAAAAEQIEAEARALAMAEAADALAESAERVEDAERRARSDSRGSSVLRGAVAGLTAFGLHSIFDDDDE